MSGLSNMFNNRNLFQKILIMVFGLVLPVVVLAAWLVTNEFVKVTTSNAGVRLQGLADNAADKLDRNLFERFGDAQAFAVSKQATSLNAPEITTWMNTMMQVYSPIYTLMVMTDKNGKIIAVNTRSKDGSLISSSFLVGRDLSQQTWFQEAVQDKISRGTSFVTDLHHEPLVKAVYGFGSDLALSFTAPVRNKFGEIVGVWTNYFNWSVAATIFEQIEKNANTEGHQSVSLMLANAQGRLLLNAVGSAETLERSVKDFASFQGATKKDKGYTNGRSLKEVGLKGRVPAIEAWSKEFGYSTYVGLGWVVSASQESSEIAAEGRGLVGAVLAAAIGVMGMIILAGWMIARYLAGRVKNMVGIANELAKGHINQKITDHSQDEIGSLARAFSEIIVHQSKMSELADKISQGDLSSQIQAAGDNDTLGLAFTRMTTNLKMLIGEIQRGSSNVASASSQILAATSQQASGVSEQSAAITQTSATVEEVKASADQAVDMANTVNDNAQAASRVAAAGVEAVLEATEGMNDIRVRVSQIAENILELSKQTQQIGEIITSVNDLADRSNLLALNAAIEAARAGEHGKGFAVVAQEIRLLAEESKKATTQVKDILGDIQKATNTAVMTTEEGLKVADAGADNIKRVGQTIDELNEAIKQAAYSAQLISASVRQHTVGMEQIAAAMQNISAATYESLGTTNHTKSAAENLNKLSNRLNDLIAGYKIDHIPAPASITPAFELPGFDAV